MALSLSDATKKKTNSTKAKVDDLAVPVRRKLAPYEDGRKVDKNLVSNIADSFNDNRLENSPPPASEKNSFQADTLLNATELTTLNDSVPPTSNTLFSENNDFSTYHTQLDTTKNNNLTQLDTSKYVAEDRAADSNLAQLDTLTRHNLTQNNSNKINNNSTKLDTTKHNNLTQLDTSEHVAEDRAADSNLAQLDTVTRHNLTQLKESRKTQRLTRHNLTQLDTQADTTRHINLTQLDTDADAIFINFLKQGGYGAIVLNFLYEEGIRQNSKNIHLSYLMLAKLTGIKETSIKTIAKRLRNERYIEISGSGGGTCPTKIFKLNDSLITSFLIAKKHSQLDTTKHNNLTQLDTQADTSPSSKLVSNNINNNYLTISEQSKPIDKATIPVAQVKVSWFKSLNFSPVAPISPMQVNSSIRNLVQEKLQPEQVQDFLNRFKSWLSTQQKIQNPLAIFCDRLKEFATEGDSAILNAMTDQEREIEAKFLEETQKARAQMQLIQMANQEKLRSHQENAKLKAEAEFEKWYESASDSELTQMAQPMDIAPLRSNLHKMSARSAFMQRFGIGEATV